jgi:putative selenium metabolism hydrolase
MALDFQRILAKAQEYQPQMSSFLREMLAIPSESCQEGAVIQRIREEMEGLGYDRVEVDPMGNILAYLGSGKHLIAMDAHIDTVGIGDRDLWQCDPYRGKEEGDLIFGRGASDQEGGMAAMVYAGRIIKDLKLEDDYTLLLVGSVQEEDCDGLCWQYIIDEDRIRPEFVVSTEPTSCSIYRGQRGRMEIRVTTHGVSCHGSAPERGDNAIYKMAPIILELRALHENLKDDEFLGRGSLAISEIFFTSPSRCAVADSCSISIDRRLTAGESWEEALEQVRRLPSVREAGAEVELYKYEKPSYTGLVSPPDCSFPAWALPEEHPACQAMVESCRGLFRQEPLVDKWTFSTNGVSIMGRYGIPVVGYGPGHESEAHAPNERTWKSELVKAAAVYAVLPSIYVQHYAGESGKR